VVDELLDRAHDSVVRRDKADGIACFRPSCLTRSEPTWSAEPAAYRT